MTMVTRCTRVTGLGPILVKKIMREKFGVQFIVEFFDGKFSVSAPFYKVFPSGTPLNLC